MCIPNWWPRVFKEPRTFEFKPGVNILWGRNGSGKSTVLRALAGAFHATAGCFPTITENSIGDMWLGIGTDVKAEELGPYDPKIFQIKHDGQGVRYFDPGVTVGLGLGGFDWDFGSEGIQNVMFKGSAGQTTVNRAGRILESIIKNEPCEVKWKLRGDRSQYNDIWGRRVKAIDEFLKPSIEKGPPTILFDEPERSLDLDYQIGMWRFVMNHADKFQFIIATHWLTAVEIPGVNYIELSENYRSLCILAKDNLNADSLFGRGAVWQKKNQKSP